MHLRRGTGAAGLSPRLVSAESVPRAESLAEAETVVAVVSTTGQGAVSRTMLPLWRSLLRKNLPSDLLTGTRFRLS